MLTSVSTRGAYTITEAATNELRLYKECAECKQTNEGKENKQGTRPAIELATHAANVVW
jgi:hypothetical protein